MNKATRFLELIKDFHSASLVGRKFRLRGGYDIQSCVSAGLIILTYDGYAVVKGGVQNTISYQLVQLSKKIPFIPFALGFLMGHFFGQMG